jgi:outer membrane protein assembly factor BamA
MSGLLLISTLWLACSVQKKIPPGEIFYKGATIKINDDTIKVEKKKELTKELRSFLRPVPNKKNIFRQRQKVWFYYLAGDPKKEKGFGYWMKYKLGQPPVFMSDVDPERNVDILTNYLENNGFYYATGKFDSTWGAKEGKVNYSVNPGYRYKIRNVSFIPDSVNNFFISKKIQAESLLKPGNYYNFNMLKAERSRINDLLKNEGYYYFNDDYILIRGDSTVATHEIDLYVTIKKETPRNALKPYYIKNVYIYPDYDASKDTLKIDSSFWHKQYYVIDPEENYKPIIFDRVISFKPGEIYNREDHNKTLNRLVNVGTFRYVKNQFESLPSSSDSGWLNAAYHLISHKRRSLRLETTGKTNSASLAGVELNLNWRNKNWFKGGEQLMVKVFGGFDIQFGGQNKGYNIYNVGAEASITWPRIVPINKMAKGAFVPYTKLTVSNDFQQRQKLYTVNTLKASFAWAWRPGLRHEHSFKPLQATFVDNSNVTQEYLDQIAIDSSLARVIEEQLIIGPEYTFIYTNTINPRKANGWFYRFNIDLSNNLLGLMQRADAVNNPKTLIGVSYNQFIKTEQELRYYRKLSATTVNQQWVSRINIGVGVPYGNSLQLPFIKQFFTGGSNFLRGFRVRSVGPGTFQPDVQQGNFIPDLIGDIKLEMNTEWRGKLFGIVHGAAFIDAGNIWLFNENASRPGGKFSSSFLKELAVAGGAGLRFDIAGIFMVRLDLGIPLRKPYETDGNHWLFKDIEIWDPQWRKENLILNVGVGLPF